MSFYGSEPRNLTARDVLNNPAFATSVLRSVQDPALRSYIVGHSVPWRGVDLPMVEFLPTSPEDRDEVNLIVGDGIARMVYRAATARWYQVGAPPIVTTLPSDPADGLTVAYNADDSNGVTWLFRYRADGDSTYPWEFIGGPPLWAEVATQENTTSTTYAALSTAGPSITVPLAGVYDVTVDCNHLNSNANAAEYMSYDIGGTGAVDADAAGCISDTNVGTTFMAATRRKTISAAATALVSKYKVSGTTGTFNNRRMTVRPVKVAA